MLVIKKMCIVTKLGNKKVTINLSKLLSNISQTKLHCLLLKSYSSKASLFDHKNISFKMLSRKAYSKVRMLF